MPHPVNYYLGRVILHPLLVLLLSGLALAAAQRFSSGRPGNSRAVWTSAAWIGSALYTTCALAYLLTVPFYDHAEAPCAATAWNYLMGFPMYHDADSAARYSIVYGPCYYLTEAASLWILGPGPFSAKLQFV